MSEGKKGIILKEKEVHIKERISGFFISLFGGFWVSFLFIIFFIAEKGDSFVTIGKYSLMGAFIFAVIGAIRPRTMKSALFPFAFFG